MKYLTLSTKTDPGRVGFRYAIEFRIVGHDRWTRFQRVCRFEDKLTENMGRRFQPHWTRKQLNRRWYMYKLDYAQTVRFCFRDAKDQLLAGLLYQ